MAGRTIMISDIHGYAQTFVALLKRVGYRPGRDRLMLLGDYVDGGPSSLECVRLVRRMMDNPLVQAIGGNHDGMFLNWLDDRDYPLMPYTQERNGGLQTIRSFCPWYTDGRDDAKARGFIHMHYPEEIAFLRNLPDFIEDDSHIYVHAGIDPEQKDWRQTTAKQFRWIRSRFYERDGQLAIGKRIIFGHEVCARLHRDETNFAPWFGKQLIGIDGGIKFGKQLNALIAKSGGRYRHTSLASCD